ncbi:hypothetical protein JET76_23050 [Pseudomonas putida]|uniref:hypothetical protein n=1 Tax=Pseudomonas putida TaxID=303 RepID=UPI0018E67251|nr:hypothetical protein [Pseudomonas putida]MBI6944207.1 hypothetical protein [Pseudomonas putida]MBI6960308.1 hypothetical protein [Pseudomonas putida]
MTKKTDAVKDAAQDLDQDLVEVTVAPRRSVVGHNGRAVGPGNLVKVPKDEVELLAARGFVLGEGGELVAKGPATLAVS